MTNETYRFSADLFRTVYRFASKEKGRYYLHGVCVQQAPKGQPGVVLVATDGAKLIVGYDPKGQAPEGQGVILQTEGNKMPGAAFNDTRKGDRVVFLDAGDQNGGMSIGRIMQHPSGKEDFTEFVSAHAFAVLDGNFPDWHRIVPKFAGNKPADSASTFNAKYVKDFAAAAQDFGGRKNAVISIWATDAASPAIVTFGTVEPGGRDLFGVLMPVRSNSGADTGAPDWTHSFDVPAIATEETVTLEAEPLKVAA